MNNPPSRAAGLLRGALLTVAVVAAFGGECRAQSDEFELGGLIGKKSDSGGIKLSASLIAKERKAGEIAVLSITAKLPRDYYIYSTKAGWSGATRIRLVGIDGLEPVGADEFTADRQPKVVFEKDLGKKGLDVEKFFDEVTWQRRFRIVKPELAVAAIELRGQYCTSAGGGQCVLIAPPYQAFVSLATGNPGPFANVESITPSVPAEGMVVEGFQPSVPPTIEQTFDGKEQRTHYGEVTWSKRYVVSPGVEPDRFGVAGTIRYMACQEQNCLIPKTLKFAVGYVADVPAKKGDPLVVAPHPLSQVLSAPKSAGGTDPVGISVALVPADAKPGDQVTLSITMKIDAPFHSFALDNKNTGIPTTLTDVNIEGLTPLMVKPAAEPALAGVEVWNLPLNPQDEFAGTTLPLFLFYAFIGGMILNVMPCVLPVIAIKVLSFVQQAGESRGRILALNLVYALGVLSVFLTLAALAVLPSEALGWGELFQKPEFNLVMACLVFALGLSLLGVFEIPVPGMVGSAAGHQQEGLLGAFLTGIFATILATPCSGPFLGATLAWSVGQTPAITFLVWGVMGLGMAFPYILFGLFPAAIKWLPKPGAWMVRFKEFSGFVLLGSVVFIISSLNEKYTIPTLVMLIGVALGLWMIGSLYDHRSKSSHKYAVRVAALALAGAISFFGYRMTTSSSDAHHLKWEAFSESKLNSLVAERKTVLIDFTADWCLTCKTVEKLSLNRAGTHEMVTKHGIVPLMADYTEFSPELKRWLDRFDSKSIPLTVIFPANDPSRPILLRDFYTQSALLKKLEQAVETTSETPKQAAISADARH